MNFFIFRYIPSIFWRWACYATLYLLGNLVARQWRVAWERRGKFVLGNLVLGAKVMCAALAKVGSRCIPQWQGATIYKFKNGNMHQTWPASCESPEPQTTDRTHCIANACGCCAQGKRVPGRLKLVALLNSW